MKANYSYLENSFLAKWSILLTNQVRQFANVISEFKSLYFFNSSLILNFADDWEGPGPDGNFQEDGGGPVNMNLVSPNMVKEWLVNLAMYELRRCVRICTRAIRGRKLAFACEIHFGKYAGFACVRPFFGRAMCDRTFAHFCTLFGTKLPENATF